MMNFNRTACRNIAVLTALLLAAGLCAALIAQYGFKLAPCELCLQQRQPYYFGIVLAIVLLNGKNFPESVLKITLGLLVLVLSWSVFLALRHSGVEWGFWPAPASCASASQAATDINALQAQLKNYTYVACDKPAWKLFGALSFANLNALLSVFLLIVNAVVLAGYDPRRLYGSSTASQ